jgi:hypothetical protein
MRSKWIAKLLIFACAAVAATSLTHADDTRLRFLIDDPVMIDRDTAANAAAVARDHLGSWADFVVNTFMSPGDRRSIPAVNVNTIGEVPNSSWFTNRIGATPLSVDEIVRGPDRVDDLAIDDWVIVQGKESGRQAGFRAVSASDPTRQLYQIEFDPRDYPEMATGAEIIGTAIYHAIGYNVVETYLTEIDLAKVTISPTATIEIGGRTRAFTRRDLDDILRRSARKSDGRYRATASRFAEGRPLGPFRYHGTRPDDPNDIYPHEHRRELRANRVFCAWLNHDDSRAINSLDMLVGREGQQYVKHYMFDFGSILGSGTNDPDHPWVGHEYVVEPRAGLLTLASFGLWRRPFIGVDSPSHLPAAGGFTADGFVPEQWKQHYPNAAFDNMRADDALWAARIVAAFSPEAISAIVEKARFSDPRVTDHVIGTLLRRRELVLQAWLPTANPIADPRIAADGWLRFVNVAENAGIGEDGSAYELTWFRYDNEHGRRTAVTTTEVTRSPAAPMPSAALSGADYIGVEIRTSHREYPQWRNPIRAYFRATSSGWEVVGLERELEASAGLRASR